MKYFKIFSPGPEVSVLCLGTGSFGTDVPKEDAFKQMDFFFGKGGNCIDSARVYADWRPNGHGASEKTVGDWIKERKCRDKVFISTKGAHPDLKTMHIPRMSHKDLRFDLEESLKALRTDYIDIYFLHRDDTSTPIDEILENLEAFRKEGKIRHYGCSNWTLARMEEAERTASRRGDAGFACDQIRFGMADINAQAAGDQTMVSMDKEIFSWHEKTGKPVMAYTSSCNGYFSKKLKGKPVSHAHEAVYGNVQNKKLLEKLEIWEKTYKLPAAALVSAYVTAQLFPAIAISSFSSLEQLDEFVRAADFDFPREILPEIRDIKQFLV